MNALLAVNPEAEPTVLEHIPPAGHSVFFLVDKHMYWYLYIKKVM